MSNIFTQGYALIIGVGADLPNTVDDAIGLANILKDPARCAYAPERVHLLTSEQADRDKILAALDILSQSTTSKSTVIIYFSGHGYRVNSTSGQSYYLMPYGYDTNQLYKTAISGPEFTGKLQAIPGQKLVVLLDCCHAGGVDDAKGSGVELTKAPIPPEAQALLAQGSGRVLIASSQENELSYAGRPYSAFTLALIEAFCGIGVAKQDGYVHVADLALHAREMVPRRTTNKQHPIFSFQQADNFVLAYYAGGNSQPKGLPFTTEPEIEPEPGLWSGINQVSQIVDGSQTNVGGDANAPVLGGVFHDRVEIGRHDIMNMHGGFYQPNMKVQGDVNQAQGDIIQAQHDAIIAGRDVYQGVEALTRIFDSLLERIKTLPTVDQAVVMQIAEDTRVHAEKIQKGDETPETQSALEKRLKSLKTMAPDIGDVAIASLANPAAGIAMVIQKIVKKVHEE